MSARHFKRDHETTDASPAIDSVDEAATENAEGAKDPNEEVIYTDVMADHVRVDELPMLDESAPHVTPEKARTSFTYEETALGLDDEDDGHYNRAMPIIAGVLVMIFLLLCAGAVWFSRVNHSLSMGAESDALTATLVKQGEEATETSKGSNAFYVLFVGSDAQAGETTSRGDVLMLARVSPSTHLLTLVSVPRDTMVNISGAVGVQKINAAYAYGGASSAVYEMSQFCGVPITHYVEIDFKGLKKMVDLLGGIEVEVPETASSSQMGAGTLEAGTQLLDGEQALAYVRERYNASGGDFGRSQAQRLIVQAIIKRLMQASPAELPRLVGSLSTCVKTDYSVTDMIALSLQFKEETTTIYSAVCPSYTLSQDGVSYDGTMFDEWRDMMKRVDAGLDPNDTDAKIPEPQASSTKLGQALNSAAPKDYHHLVSEGMTTGDTASSEAEEEDGED